MSWSKTYSHNVLYGIDCLGAVLFWNQPDMTISTLCRLVQLSDVMNGITPVWTQKLFVLKLYKWQIAVLRWLAPKLDRIQVGHCEIARQADIERAQRILTLLS